MTTPQVDRSHRTFISYIDRTREYYRALGYENPYQWSHYGDVPFAELAKPLAETRIALITTASPQLAGKQKPGPKEVWSGNVAEAPKELYTDDLAWDKDNTHTRDRETFLPIDRMEEYVAAGRIGGLAARFHGVPTEYSQRRTITQDAPEVLRRCREDGVEAAVLVPL